MRERFGLTDQQIALLLLTAVPAQSNAAAETSLTPEGFCGS